MSKGTILILEDDASQRDFYRVCLQTKGFNVVTAADSGTVRELVLAHKPKLIITDLVMPEHEGMEAIFGPLGEFDIPVIAMSAYPQYLEFVKPFVALALAKPLSASQLTAAVDSVLGVA